LRFAIRRYIYANIKRRDRFSFPDRFPSPRSQNAGGAFFLSCNSREGIKAGPMISAERGSGGAPGLLPGGSIADWRGPGRPPARST